MVTPHRRALTTGKGFEIYNATPSKCHSSKRSFVDGSIFGKEGDRSIMLALLEQSKMEETDVQTALSTSSSGDRTSTFGARYSPNPIRPSGGLRHHKPPSPQRPRDIL